MRPLIITVLLLLTTACGGAPFDSATFEEIAGQGGESPESGAGGSVAGLAGSAPLGGSAPVAGTASGGSQGGAPVAGSGSAGDVGEAGAAGAADTCGVLPHRSKWLGAASSFYIDNPPELAFDGDPNTNFTSSGPQSGIEWFQIDFKQRVTLTQVTLLSNYAEHTHGYRVTLSDKSLDMKAPTAAEGMGYQGSLVIDMAPVSGRYLMIYQTAEAPPFWWGVSEITIACEP